MTLKIHKTHMLQKTKVNRAIQTRVKVKQEKQTVGKFNLCWIQRKQLIAQILTIISKYSTYFIY